MMGVLSLTVRSAPYVCMATFGRLLRRSFGFQEGTKFSMSDAPRTMFQKVWDNHVVHAEDGQQTILYIDLQLVHEVTSPQAFEGLRLAGRKVRRPSKTIQKGFRAVLY